MQHINMKQETAENIATRDQELQLVGFTIDEEEFGLDILKVQEINRMSGMTRVPNAPEYVDGVVNLRGKVIPIIDLRLRLGMRRKEKDKNTRIIVVESSGRTVGFVVDSVSEVLRIPKSVTEPTPEIVTNVATDYISGIGKMNDRLLILLDLDRVVSARETKMLDAVA